MSANGVKVGGAWAAFEYQQQQHKAVINELCSQASAGRARKVLASKLQSR